MGRLLTPSRLSLAGMMAGMVLDRHGMQNLSLAICGSPSGGSHAALFGHLGTMPFTDAAMAAGTLLGLCLDGRHLRVSLLCGLAMLAGMEAGGALADALCASPLVEAAAMALGMLAGHAMAGACYGAGATTKLPGVAASIRTVARPSAPQAAVSPVSPHASVPKAASPRLTT